VRSVLRPWGPATAARRRDGGGDEQRERDDAAGRANGALPTATTGTSVGR
jgi:hypothetical protein